MTQTPTASAVKLHAKLSPSSSARWTACHVAPRREAALGDNGRESNVAADWGTIAHDLSEKCLVARNNLMLRMALGKEGRVEQDGTVTYLPAGSGGIPIDDELIECCESYIDFVRDLAVGGTLHIEQRLSIEHITGEPGARGTSDCVVEFDTELDVADLKGGMGKVYAKELLSKPVLLPNGVLSHVKPNTQLVMYAEAYRNEVEFFKQFEKIRIIIVQPRLVHVDEHVMPIAELVGWVMWIREQADKTREPDAVANPGEKQCQWCKVWPCPEAEALVIEQALDGFGLPNDPPADPVDLGRRKSMLPLIRQYCDSIDTATYRALANGEAVEGWKMIDGELGDRYWEDETRVVWALADFGLTEDDYTKKKIVGPAGIEKLVQGRRANPAKKLRVDQWEDLQTYIKRDKGSPKVVPASDPRPARNNDPLEGF